MAQEDRGLVIRGLALLVLIGGLVSFVLAMIFWRVPAPAPKVERPPENYVALAVVPVFTGYPANISWGAVYELGRALPSAPGWEVRYNAATTLARRGSAEVPWPLIREMLDENQQMHNYQFRQPDGRVVVDEAAARAIMLSALQALTVWHEKQKSATKPAVGPQLKAVYAAVDQLTQSQFSEMKQQAEKARSTFFH